MNYDHDRRRWAGYRPLGFRWSQMILGRCDTQEKILANGITKPFYVSAYTVRDGRMCYSYTTNLGPRSDYSRIKYRIRVTLKEK